MQRFSIVLRFPSLLSYCRDCCDALFRLCGSSWHDNLGINTNGHHLCRLKQILQTLSKTSKSIVFKAKRSQSSYNKFQIKMAKDDYVNWVNAQRHPGKMVTNVLGLIVKRAAKVPLACSAHWEQRSHQSISYREQVS